MQVKKCADCGVEKELNCFGPTKQKLKFGVRSRCLPCERIYKNKWVKENPIRVKKTHADWYVTNRQKVRKWNDEYRRRMLKEQPKKVRAYERKCRLKRMYKVTPEWFNEQSAKQNGLCKICGGPPDAKGLCIDHCHKTGRVRALLCTHCNTGLHKMERDIEWVRKAEAYLMEFD